MFCRSLFVLVYFFIWPLRCLFFLDIQILITALAFSNSSYVLLYRKFHGWHNCLVNRYGIVVSEMNTDMSQSQSQLVTTSGAGTAYPPGAPEFTPCLLCRSLIVCVVLCLLSVFFLFIALQVLRFTTTVYLFVIFNFFVSFIPSRILMMIIALGRERLN